MDSRHGLRRRPHRHFPAWFFYCRPFAGVARALDAEPPWPWYKVIYHKFYFDEIYYAVTRQFIFAGVAQWMKNFDDYVIGGHCS